MRYKGKAEIFGEIEGIYGRERYLGEVRRLRKCNGLGGGF